MSNESLMSLREHFSELKRRAKVAFISFAVLFVAMLAIPANPGQVASAVSGGGGTYVPLIAFFMARVKLELLPPGWVIIGLNVNAALEVYLIASLLFALIFNAPIFAYETIMFINPGLKESERKLIFPFIGAASSLFAVGVLFGYFFLAHFLLIALSPFFVATGLTPTISGLDFYTVVFITVAMSGIAFTVPVYVYTAIRLGFVQASTFQKNRLIIWVVTYIVCAIVTPDGGPLLDILLFVPIIVLLEMSVWLGARSSPSRRREQEEAGETTARVPSAPSSPSVSRSLPTPATGPSTTSPPATPAPVPSVPQSPSPAPAKHYCIYCLTEMPAGSIFCPNCGKSSE